MLAGVTPVVAAAQTGNVPLSPEAWIATDSIRFVSYLGRPSLYINRGVALVRGASMENGVLDLDLAASDTTTFLGVVFRATTPRFSNVLFPRPGASGTEEAVQYGPAFNSLGVAWQVYHGDGANAVAVVPRNRWIQGVAAGRHRIARLMRREGIVACTERRFRWTATARAELPAAPDRLRRDFTAAAPNQRWVADITSVRTGQGWRHLAIVLDLYARRIVGWAMAPTLDQQLAAEALAMALADRRPAPGLLVHSDRGGPYLATQVNQQRVRRRAVTT